MTESSPWITESCLYAPNSPSAAGDFPRPGVGGRLDIYGESPVGRGWKADRPVKQVSLSR